MNTEKVVAAPNQKRKIGRTQQQALIQLDSSFDQIGSVQIKNHKLTLEADLTREQLYLKFKQEELQRNYNHEEKITVRAREHEIRVTETYLRAIVVNNNQGNYFSPPPPTHMHSITTTMQYNAMTATDFPRSFAAPFSTASVSSPICYEMNNNECSVSKFLLGK